MYFSSQSIEDIYNRYYNNKTGQQITNPDNLSTQVWQANWKYLDNFYNRKFSGSSKIDWISSTQGGNSLFDLKGGDDWLKLDTHTNTTVILGNGDDLLESINTILGSYNGNSGNDILRSINGKDNTMNGGTGNDLLYSQEDKGTTYLNGNDGNDYFEILKGYSVQSKGSNDNDTFMIDNISAGIIYGGSGIDNVILNAYRNADNTDFDYGKMSVDQRDTIIFSAANGSMVIKKDVETFTYVDQNGATQEISYNDLKNVLQNNDWKYIDGAIGQIIEGTDLKDMFWARNGSNNQFNLKGGNDQLRLTNENSDSVFMGDGNDSVEIQGSHLTIVQGGTGNDTLSSDLGNLILLEGQDGDDVITAINGQYDDLSGGAGNDTLTLINETFSSVEGGEGNDRLIVDKKSSGMIHGGAGNDFVDLTAFLSGDNKLDTSNMRIRDNGQIVLLNDHGTMFLDTDIEAVQAGNIYRYSDFKEVIRNSAQIEVRDAENVVVDGTEYGETVLSVNVKDSTFNLGAGPDKFMSVDNLIGSTVNLGDGNDELDVSKRPDGATIDNNTFTGGAGNDNLNIAGATNSIVDGGTDNDTFTAHLGDHNTYLGGDGDDDFTNIVFETNVTLDGGTGNDKFLINAGVTGVIKGGDNNDTISLDKFVQPDGSLYFGNMRLDANGKIVFLNTLGSDALTVDKDVENFTFTINTPQGSQQITYSYDTLASLIQTANPIVIPPDTHNQIINGTEYSDYVYIEEGTENTGNTINLNGANDVLYARAGDHNTYNGGTGQDNMWVTNNTNAVIDSGDDIDLISMENGHSNQAFSGAGDDYIQLTSTNVSWADGGEGNDSIMSTNGTNNVLRGKEGNDSLRVNNETLVHIAGGSGDDTIILDTKSSGVVLGGFDNDTVDLNSFVREDGLALDFSKMTLDAGDKIVLLNENGTLTLERDIETFTYKRANGQIQSLSYDELVAQIQMSIDTIIEPNTHNQTFDRTDYKDYVYIEEGTENTGNTINLNGANDVLYARAGDHNTYNGGTGQDNMWVTNNTNAVIDSGDDIDLISMENGHSNQAFSGAGDDYIQLTSTNVSWADGGEGNDSIMSTNGTNNVLRGKEGNDSLRVNNETLVHIAGGSGDDTIILDTKSSGVVLGGFDNDTVDLNSFVREDGLALDFSKMTLDAGDKIVLLNENGTLTLERDIETFTYKRANGQIQSLSYDELVAQIQMSIDTIIEPNTHNQTFDRTDYKDYVYIEEGTENTGNTINLNGANDVLYARAGDHNTYNGGTGQDNMWVTNNTNAVIDSGDDIDLISMENGHSNQAFSGAGDDYIQLTSETMNLISGGAGNDGIYELNGINNIFHGNDGNDFFAIVNSAKLALFGDDGDDQIILMGDTSSGYLSGGSGFDTVNVGNYIPHLNSPDFSRFSLNENNQIMTDTGLIFDEDIELFDMSYASSDGYFEQKLTYDELRQHLLTV